MLPVGAQPPRHREKGKERIWRGNSRHALSSIVVPLEETQGWGTPGASPAVVSTPCSPVLVIITATALLPWREHCPLPCSSVPSSSIPGEDQVIPCPLREELIDKNDKIQLHSHDQISPEVSLHRGVAKHQTSLTSPKL